MFTGIIQEIGTIKGRRERAEGVTFELRAPRSAAMVSAGDSIAVSGVCQTVEAVRGDRVEFTAVGETLQRTTLGALEAGSAVNLERPVTPQAALGGHFVQGHVDGVGVVESFERQGKDRLLAVRVPESVANLMVPKGSVAVDGVSLTIVESRPDGVITITIIPFTLEQTILGDFHAGTRVNIEADIIGKYVWEYLARLRGAEAPLERANE